MKKTAIYIGTSILVATFLSSCVSKRKYEDLARAKREVDRNFVEMRDEKLKLEKDLESSREEFNAVRYSLTANNSEKDKRIDGLYNRLRTLESKQMELKSELVNAADQIRTTTQSSGEQISALERSLEKMTAERDNIRKELDDVQSRLQFENQTLKSKANTADAKNTALQSELDKQKEQNAELNKKLGWLRKTKAESDAEIKKLTNQVKLLKKELSK